MSRFVLSPEAVDDLDAIKATLIARGDKPLARYVLRALRLAMQFLAETPGAGHSRSDLTDDVVKFWSVFSYLIVYDPAVRPLAIVRVIHGHRDVETVLKSDRAP